MRHRRFGGQAGLAYCRYWVWDSGHWEKGEDGSRKGLPELYCIEKKRLAFLFF